MEINVDNSTFKLIQNNIHPNLFILESNILDENIKIEQVRNLLKFLNKSTYSKNLKIVLLDNAEHLNLNSSNALLKALEEPALNTYFFVVYNNSLKILDTIRSRCIQFNFNFSIEEKKNIFIKISENFNFSYDKNKLDDFFYFESPGNLLRYLFELNSTNLDIFDDKISCIQFLMDKYKNKNKPELLNFASLLIEKFYNDQILKSFSDSNLYIKNKNKISNLINYTKKFNLEKKNLVISINRILNNET